MAYPLVASFPGRKWPGLQEVSVCNRIVQSVFLATALFLVSALPAAAQTDAFSGGLAFMSDNGGVGVNADYSKATSMKANDRTMGWVVDGSYNHKGFGGFGTDFSVNTVTVSGGIRLAGKAGDKATWHVQGTAGLFHAAASVDNLTQSICDLAGVDCSASSNSFMIMPGGAVTYWFSDKGGVKGQLNIPIAVGGDSGSAIRFDINYVMKLGK
jgi:hypothetical protein